MPKIAALLFVAAVSCYAAPGPCHNEEKLAEYNGYKILKVEILDPIGFIAPWASRSKTLKGGLKLKENEQFSLDSYNQDVLFLSASLRGEFTSSRQPLKLAFATGQLQDCDPAARTLWVSYPIFSSVVPVLIAPSIEEQTSETQRPSTTGATRAAANPVQASPLGGYDQTRGTWGGLNFSYTTGNVHLKGESEVSANSRNGHLDFGGKSGPVGKLWKEADWAGTFEYLDTPAGTAAFEEGKLTGRFSASTEEFTKSHIIFRYGGDLEGGHQQSRGTSATAGLTPNSSYGSLKLYAGTTGRPSNGAFTASYGLQLGSTLRSGTPVFSKHLLDLGYNASFPIPYRKPIGDQEEFTGPLSGVVHRLLMIETRLSGGLIQNASGTPLAERFFGGNVARLLVQDDAWSIQSDALIRSIPENQLGALTGVGTGGTRFYSANSTVSFTVWGMPMLPKDLAAASKDVDCKKHTAEEQGQFPCVLNFGFESTALTLANSNKLKDPDYIRQSAQVPVKAGELVKKLAELADKLKEITPPPLEGSELDKAVKKFKSKLLQARGAASLIATSPDPQVVYGLVSGTLPALVGLEKDLADGLQKNSQAKLATEAGELVNEANSLGKEMEDADKFPSDKFRDQAWKTLAPGHRAIDVFLHDLNIFSVAPVAMFDVARVWPVHEGVRYGVGPGVRFSMANANFTLGYAVNPQPLGKEKTGAIYFKLDVTSMF
jgi:hypothetical protein